MPKALTRKEQVERLLEPAVLKELAIALPGFDRKSLLQALIDCWGGLDRLAKDIFVEFQAAPVGSPIRQKYMSLVCLFVSQESRDAGARPTDELDDAELVASIASYAGKVRVGVAPLELESDDG